MQRTKTPELVPEDADPVLLKSIQSITSTFTVKQRLRGILTRISDYSEDPRIGPILLLGSLMSFGTIWLRRAQPSSQSNPPSEPNSGVSDGFKFLTECITKCICWCIGWMEWDGGARGW